MEVQVQYLDVECITLHDVTEHRVSIAERIAHKTAQWYQTTMDCLFVVLTIFG